MVTYNDNIQNILNVIKESLSILFVVKILNSQKDINFSEKCRLDKLLIRYFKEYLFEIYKLITLRL